MSERDVKWRNLTAMQALGRVHIQMDYFQPTSLADALAIAGERKCLVMAGGTDVFPTHATKPIVGPVLDLS